jgi:hypothetical protein
MRQSLQLLLVSLLVAAVCGGATQACINDREVGTTEREFKSQYNHKPAEPSAPAPETSDPANGSRLLVYGGMAAGALMLLGAGVLCVTKPRRS